MEKAAVDIGFLLLKGLHRAFEVVGKKLIVVVERLVKFRVALLDGLTVKPAAVLDICLQSGADQRQAEALGESFTQRPWSIDKEDYFKFPVGLRGNAVDGIVEIRRVNPIMNPHAEGHLGIPMLERSVGHFTKHRTVGSCIV